MAEDHETGDESTGVGGAGGGDREAAAPEPRAGPGRRGLRSLATLVVAVAIYYALPIGRISSSGALAASVVTLVVGVPALGWLAARRVQRFVTGSGTTPVRVEGLMAVVYLVILAFAAGYFGLDRADDTQFSGLETKTDSLYFTVVTVGTVGYGDIFASGQLARALVSIQIVFDLVVIGTLVTVVTGQVRQRTASRAQRGEHR